MPNESEVTTEQKILLASQVADMLRHFYAKPKHTFGEWKELVMRTFTTASQRLLWLRTLQLMEEYDKEGGYPSDRLSKQVPLDPDTNLAFRREFDVAVRDEVAKKFALTEDVLSILGFTLGSYRSGSGEIETEITRLKEGFARRKTG